MTGPGTVNNRTQVQVPLDQNETIYLEETKPNVFNIALATLKTVSSLSVSKFLGGAPNQVIKVKAEGSVTIVNNGGGLGSVITNTGANKTLAPNRIYTFTNVNDIWYEEADSQGSGGVSNPLTINDSGSGETSPASFDGLAPITISSNTVGAPNINDLYDDPTWINTLEWGKITSTPTTIAGYGITDFVSLGDAEWVQLDGAYSNPSWLVDLPYSKITGTPSLSGYVVGPASATDHAVARYDLTTGKLIQDSLVIIDDSGNTSIPGTLIMSADDIILQNSARLRTSSDNQSLWWGTSVNFDLNLNSVSSIALNIDTDASSTTGASFQLFKDAADKTGTLVYSIREDGLTALVASQTIVQRWQNSALTANLRQFEWRIEDDGASGSYFVLRSTQDNGTTIKQVFRVNHTSGILDFMSSAGLRMLSGSSFTINSGATFLSNATSN